jgi:hypothetical protein
VGKFAGIYKTVFDTKELEMSLEEVLSNVLKVYKVEYFKHQSFVVLHCELVLKDIPRWMDFCTQIKAFLNPEESHYS